MTTQVLNQKSPPLSTLESARAYLAVELLGQQEVTEFSLACLLAGGHLLLEGPPGTGKTSLAQALAHCFGGSFRRIQMTSDLLPSDVVGVLRPTISGNDFEFRQGPIFTNFLLADELNRTSPKTQAALLEAMAEGTATVDGVSHKLPDPFFVVATQNPFEFQGVYPLPESQLDRFMMQLLVTHPEEEHERAIYRRELDSAKVRDRSSTLTLKELQELRQLSEKTFLEESVLLYCQKIVAATRTHAKVRYGVSVRGALQYIRAAQALAFVRGRDFVKPSDLQDLAPVTLAHRLCFGESAPTVQERYAVIEDVIEGVTSPK